MPTPNPVTRFGRGFHGFAPQVTNFGPYEGDPNAPKGSTRYNLWRDGYYDSRGNPHRPGDIALTPDLARKYRYGDIVTEGGVTGRFTDVTNSRLTNRVDVWKAGDGKQPTTAPATKRVTATPEPALPQTPGMDNEPGLFASNQTPSIEITSPGPQTPSIEITPRTEPTPGRSATLTTDPNEDWIGTEQASPTLFANQDAGYEAVSPTLSGETLQSLPNEPYQAAAQPTPSASPVFADEWWKSPSDMGDAGTGLTADAGSIWGETSIFGSADAATGRTWDSTVMGGSEEGSHAFDFIESSDEPPALATGRSPALIDDPNLDWTGTEGANPPAEPGNPPSLISDTDDDWIGADEEKKQYASSSAPSGLDIRTFGMPQRANQFGLGGFLNTPLSAMHFGEGYPVAGGDIEYANGAHSYTPGDTPGILDIDAPATPEAEANFAEAERRGNAETAGLRESGQLPPQNDSGALTPGQYARATFGGLTPTGYRDTRGSAIFDSQAANALLMWSTGMTGNLGSRSLPTSRDGSNRFSSGRYRMDDQGGFERVGERNNYLHPTQRLIAGVTANGRPWPAPVSAGGHG